MHYPLFDVLNGPIHSPNSFDPRWRPRRGEVAVGPDWQVVLPNDAADPVRIAVDDFRDFLRTAAGFDPAVAEGPEPRRGSGSAVELRLDAATAADLGPEGCRIAARPGRVVLTAAGPAGLMYGLFHLEDEMRFRRAPILAAGIRTRRPWLTDRIFRSPMAFYYSQELERVDDAYPESYLLKLAHQSFNGIWLREQLRELVRTRLLPEFAKHSDRLLGRLNALIAKCAKYNIKVYLYLTEPLGLSDAEGRSVFRRHPHVRGESPAGWRGSGLCSSRPEVKAYLREGFAELFRRAPGLGGVILITASEHPSHCWSHVWLNHGQPGPRCPRCRRRTPQEVVAEIVSFAQTGVRRARSSARVIAWNWSWTMWEDDPQAGVIEHLPAGVAVMGDFERGGKRRADGFAHIVDEYSLAYVGPSERFRGLVRVARSCGHEVYAKLQVGVTHELATVPYLPVLPNVAEKFLRARRLGVTGAMECWNFGNILSRNTEIAHHLSWQGGPADPAMLLRRLAERDFGRRAAADVVRAWGRFARAMDHFPFDTSFCYSGPMHHGGAYPLLWRKSGRPPAVAFLLPNEVTYNVALDVPSEYGDDISRICRQFGEARVVRGLRRLGAEWAKGLGLLRRALARVPSDRRAGAQSDYRVAAAVRSQFESAANFIEFTWLRDRMFHMYNESDRPRKRAILDRLEAIARAELANAAELKRLAQAEPALGFHGEAFGYVYTPAKIDRKLTALRCLLTHDIPAYRRRLRRW